MIKNRRVFSLLEVLIALVLIVTALPLLLTPFIYATVDQMETIEKIKQQKVSLDLITLLLADLHTGIISLEHDAEHPFRSEWKAGEGTYKFRKIKPKRDVEGNGIELWQALFFFKDKKETPFSYEFVIKRG